MVGELEEDGRAGRGRHVSTSGFEVTVTETSNEGPNEIGNGTVEQGMRHGDLPSHSRHRQNEAMRDVPLDREMAASADPEAVDDAEFDNIDLIDDIEVVGDHDEPSAVGIDSENETMAEDAVDSPSEDCHADPRDDTGDYSNTSVPRSGGAYVGARQNEASNSFINLTGDAEIENGVDIPGSDGDTSNSDGGNLMLIGTGPGGDGPNGGGSLEEIDLDHIPSVRRNRQMTDLNNDEEISPATKRLRTSDQNTPGGSTSTGENVSFGPALDNVDVIPVTNAGAGNPSSIQWRHLTQGKKNGTGYDPELLHRLIQTGSSDVRSWSANVRFSGFCMFILNVIPLDQNSPDADVDILAGSISTWARTELNSSFSPVIENGMTVGYTVRDAPIGEAATTASNGGADGNDGDDGGDGDGERFKVVEMVLA
ncbi:unnamed protein product [Fusarium fujikuroi]|uniref:Uncharacterized protein n=1 Tax=Fusarium fujikuroi TaxID=5127 RepID=A0A2H3RR22_FUSFU|nr:uncharacterized protein Y057_11707 [Fusarium fujikuroi]QGI78942.1 hypothetical protein CEK25_005671 [Fusarium fujikuroi]SCN76076.1 uncharacterized protein FFE2_03353 [Fusarium fujikuroi]SCN94413.1 uncharacterized protein FFC1_06932 [Fusarium fujikuroi]SCO48747.1 uncharacterized protein FFNC_12303 [Fusarium fujikuroi]